jgi:hypothetical protein
LNLNKALKSIGMVTMTFVSERAFWNGVARAIPRFVAKVRLVLLNTTQSINC